MPEYRDTVLKKKQNKTIVKAVYGGLGLVHAVYQSR